MSKTIFAVANDLFLDDKFLKASVLYEFLICYCEANKKPVFDGYEFNLSLCMDKLNLNGAFSAEASLDILAFRALQVLSNLVDQSHFESLLSKYEDLIRKKIFSDRPMDLRKALKVASENFNPELYAYKNNIDQMYDALIDYIVKYEIQADRKLFLAVDDLKAKLWGGFSNQVVELLLNSIHSGKYDAKSKAKAALVLGKWYAVNEDWSLSIKYIKIIKKFDESLFRNKRVKLLLIQSLINNSEFDSARSMINYALNKEMDSDYICADTNLKLKESGQSADQERLDEFNRIFIKNNLLAVSLKPNAGYVFGSWDYPEYREKWVVDGPKISVLMPVYGAEEFIDVAINSMLGQTWRNIEIIAVEDCSPDASWERLKELAKKDSRLKIYKNDVNMGAYPTRNRALSLATGDFITVHDSDDWSHPQMLEKQMEVLLADSNLKATCSFMTRVHPDLSFILRPSRENLEYVHRSYPSLLMRKDDVLLLGQWDGTSANADDEFIQRIRIMWGADSIGDVMPHVPFSLFLVHENSLTQQKGTSLTSLTFGIRKTYADQAAYWRRTRAEVLGTLNVQRTSLKSPFPIPQNLAPKNWEKDRKYDLVIISDLSLLGGTRRCNEAYIKYAAELGLRVGLFHWPRFDLKLAKIADEYYELCYLDNVDLLVPEDDIEAGVVLIHHPPILKYKIDAVPQIQTSKVMILINQSPMQRWSQQPFYYDPMEVGGLCVDLFGVEPTWVPISGRVAEILNLVGGYKDIYPEIWSPPYSYELDEGACQLPNSFGGRRDIVVGRHARDHWTKWPQTAQAIQDAYCAERSGIVVRLLGGQDTPLKKIGRTPSNWDVLEFDSIDVTEFIHSLDFFLHYVNEDYIEEFGRNVMEAMAIGRVVILPAEFKEIFGDAAVYAKAADVERVCKHYWDNPELYLSQVQKGKLFVKSNCSKQVVQKRIQNALSI